MTPTPCGCAIGDNGHIHGMLIPKIIWCPLHANAEKFKEFVERMAKMPDSGGCEGYVRSEAQALLKEIGDNVSCNSCDGSGYIKSNTIEYEGPCPDCSAD